MSGRGGPPQHIPRPPGAEPGRPSSWAGLTPDERRLDVAAVQARLARFGPPRAADVEVDGVRASAVLAPLYDDEGSAHVVLTRRSRHLRSHRSQVSFPGGGHEPGDVDLVATARREANEEIGLDPASVTIIGELDHLTTVSSESYIVPYVGHLPARPDLVADPGEVEHILYVSLAELLGADVYHEEKWPWSGRERYMSFFELEGDTVWGATAFILRQLLTISTGGDPRD